MSATYITSHFVFVFQIPKASFPETECFWEGVFAHIVLVFESLKLLPVRLSFSERFVFVFIGRLGGCMGVCHK